jgi:hypothetical protein
MGDPPSASAWQETLRPTSDHGVEREKRLDKEEKAEEKNGNNKLILIEKTGFITYRLSVSQLSWKASLL